LDAVGCGISVGLEAYTTFTILFQNTIEILDRYQAREEMGRAAGLVGCEVGRWARHFDVWMLRICSAELVVHLCVGRLGTTVWQAADLNDAGNG